MNTLENTDSNRAITFDQVFHIYGELFPSEFEFLVLYNLYQNYPSEEVQYSEIKQAILDTSRLPFISNGRDPQVEKTFKGLLRTFIERVPSKFNHFILTPHAVRIVQIVTHRISNPYLRFPLRETFETYFALPDDIGTDIELVKRWFKLGFQNNAQQVVIGHLEGLKISVDNAIKALNDVLDADHQSAIHMLEQFSKQFQVLGNQARQITEATKMKVEVHYQLRDLVAKFAQQADISQLNEDGKSGDIDGLQYARKIAFGIKEEVYAFFEKVDQQLDLINTKMAFAASKITELQESLRAQSTYKINLKKMLVYLLENSNYDSQRWIRLPEKFPVKKLVQQKFRFRALRYYDMGFLKKTNPVLQEPDIDYESNQKEEFELELTKQALIQMHYEQMEKDLASSNAIEISKQIFTIMNHQAGLEIAIQVGYEFIRNLDNNETIEIKEDLQTDISNTIHLWKTTVKNAQNSIS